MIAQSLNISVWSLFTILVDDFIKKKLTLYRALWLLNKKKHRISSCKDLIILADRIQHFCKSLSGEVRLGVWSTIRKLKCSVNRKRVDRWKFALRNQNQKQCWSHVLPDGIPDSSRISSPRFHCDWCILERYIASNLAFQTNACGARFARQWKLVPLAQQPTVSQIHTCAAIFVKKADCMNQPPTLRSSSEPPDYFLFLMTKLKM